MHPIQNEPPPDAVHGIHEQLRFLAVPIGALTPDPVNARAHDKRNLESILWSYKEHGQRKPIVVQHTDAVEHEDGRVTPGNGYTIRAGNGQHAAAKRLGWTHIAAVIVDEADADAVAYALRDNRTAELASWDLPNLSDQLRYLDAQEYRLEEIGWEPFEYEPLMAAEWEPPQVGGDDFVVPEKRVSLMFTRAQWESLKELLSAKPSAELVLARLEGREE